MNAIQTKSIANFAELIRRSNPESKVLTLCKLGRLKEALDVLHSHPTPLSPSTYSSLLQLCIDCNAKQEGRSLHDYLSAIGHASNLHLCTKFVIFYAKVGDLVAARRVFVEMPERSVVSWTAMISGYSQNGYSDEALKVFSWMRRLGVKANQFTYGSALRACTGLGCVRSGGQIHGCIVKSRFVEDLFVQSALVDLHLKCGSVEDAWCLFGMMEKRDVVAWNSVIGGCAVRGLEEDAFGYFCLMLRDGLQPDHFTFGSLLKACGLVRTLVHVNQIHAFSVKLGYENQSIVTGSLIDAYAKCRSMQNARLVYDSMYEQDLISCTALITGYSLERNCSGKALELFCEINRMGMRIDDVILCSMINICANIASLSLGRQIHAHVIKKQSNHDIALSNALIDMYAKSGELWDARCAFDEMQYKNVISWTSLIAGYGKHGSGEGAIALFVKMEDDGVKPNDVTFLSLLSACSHSGLTNKGMEYFKSMVSKYGIHPRAEHYSCAVDLLARGGQLQEAYDFVCKMDAKPNASLWAAVLGACRMHGNTSLGEIAAGYLLNLYPERSVNYVVLANTYASAGLWESAWKIRKLMLQRATKKDAGCSYI
ncbi:pentatricopeptide repeat-containing protein At3g20730 [Elaeis guineensis]|uniref:Pentatricopeptide repeat-containing protein At3g20730 n=1 Tax=Elaeis guineensis var. tenera TaxID=51953 RepID=A0A6I9RTE5_ELAGV|nr:pentatricopeptide repeat-containing protein At3g20730 [Elaeis guineensis]XP_029122708.1 pentatricopeptide repeat-containing protein At3g20730 [Elaeis guineensis]XP_029122709.1 pentatricopeptide repeat-containing protein At3g20730 [Elaeis guineensis]